MNERAVTFLEFPIPDGSDPATRELRERYVELLREEEREAEEAEERLAEASDFNADEIERSIKKRFKRTEQLEDLMNQFKQTFNEYLQLCYPNERGNLEIKLVNGLTMFGVVLAREEHYSKYLPPIDEQDWFVRVDFPDGLDEESVRTAYHAYLFELSDSLGLTFRASPRALDVSFAQPLYSQEIPNVERVRPLLGGRGMGDVLDLYNKATASTEADVQILFYVKVLEFVSATVVRENALNAVRAKLMSRRALDPDSSFIMELQALFDSHRAWRKDKEAIRQAVSCCCTLTDLVEVAPPFLAQTLERAVKSDAERDRTDALNRISDALYSTRNQVAHAKANYEPSGFECPVEQLAAFAEFARDAAVAAIRWFGFLPPGARVL